MRRIRFNLRTLAAVVLITSVALGYWHFKSAQKRRLADSINAKGGNIYWSSPSVRFLPRWIAKRLPREYSCVPLNINTVGITDSELSSIVQLFPTVESIGFDRPALANTGLSRVAQLQSLTQLRIYGDEIPDISPAVSCRHLVRLDIDSPSFGDNELAELDGTLSLELLMLFRTRVTPQGLTKLKDKLPSCEIVAFPNSHSDKEQSANLQYDLIQRKFVHVDIPAGASTRLLAAPAAGPTAVPVASEKSEAGDY